MSLLWCNAELIPDEADDSLDNSETVSLKAESLSGDSVRGSRSCVVVGPLFVDCKEGLWLAWLPFSDIPDEEHNECEVLLLPVSDDPDIEVAPDIVEFVRECVRVDEGVHIPPGAPAAGRKSPAAI